MDKTINSDDIYEYGRILITIEIFVLPGIVDLNEFFMGTARQS